jgi:hypothetical protein
MADLMSVDRPVVLLCFCANLSHGALLLRPAVVAAVTESIVDNYPGDSDAMATILILEVVKRLLKEGEADHGKIFWFNRNNDLSAGMVVGRRG